MEKLKYLYSHFAREVLKKDYILSAYREKDNSFDIISVEEENDCLYVKTRELLSKEYGFIKWLVENEKIDLEELIAQAQEKIRLNLFGYKDNKELDTDLLLILLSIQDEPIRFLIDLLQ